MRRSVPDCTGLRHHKSPLSPEDPDLPLSGGYPISRQSFFRKARRDLSGMTYFKALKYFTFRPPETQRSSLWILRHPFFVGLVLNAAGVAIFTLLGRPWIFVLLWILPPITLLQFFLRLRGVTEHAGLVPDKDQRFSTRTVHSSWQTFLLAPHNVNFHLEHHIYPGVPFYRLPELHSIFRHRDLLPEQSSARNYQEVFTSLVPHHDG